MVLASILLVAELIAIKPVTATEKVAVDPDDPAIWRNAANLAESRIVGTDKEGGLFVFDLNGKIRERRADVNHPNNVDVEYGFKLGARTVDLAVAAERGSKRLRIFAVGEGKLEDLTGSTATFVGESGPSSECMGIALYKRPTDGAIFAFVSRKEPGRGGYVWQYLLTPNASGKIDLVKVREVGEGIESEVESLAVDDELGHLYMAEELKGVYKYWADPSRIDAHKRLATFGTEGFRGDREGVAIYAQPGGKGYIVCTDQVKEKSEYRVYSRSGTASDPNDHTTTMFVLAGGADETDGIEVDSKPYPGYPDGLLIAMNSVPKNFLYFAWPRAKIQALR